MSHSQVEPEPPTIPQIPKEFGKDGGCFFKHYDALANELDEDMVKRLKSQLDSILIFAGLFAGVNSAFLALVLPDMKADPADDTNALLLQLVVGGNSTIQSARDLPSAKFTPSPGIVPVSLLWALSLMLAIITSFVAVLGQQWLVRYRSSSGGGKDHQRWEQLQRYLGAKRWCLEGVLNDVVPTLLQLALLIFCVGFLIYLQTLSHPIFYVAGILFVVAVQIGILMQVGSAIDRWCPFKSTWSHFIKLAYRDPKRHWPLKIILSLVLCPLLAPLLVILSIAMILAVILLIGAIPFYYLYRALSPLQIFGDARWLVEQLFEIMKLIPKAYWRLKANVLLEKPSPFLQAAAVGRVLCTSGDFDTLIYTAINIQAMEEDGTRYLLGDDTVREHLEKLITSPEKALASAFSCALAHLLLRGLSAKLVQTEGSVLKRLKASVERLMYHGDLERLKRKVGLISDRLEPGTKSSFTLPENLVEVQSYFRLLKLLLDKEAGRRELLGWLNETIKEQQNAKVSTPLVICLVASTVRILKEGIESEGATSRLQIWFRESEVQKKRLEVIRELAGTVDTEMQLLRSDPSQSDWSVLGLIAEAFTACRSESVQHLEAELWLLEQALSLSMLNRHEQGWKFVAETSAHLLVSLNDPADPNNRLRCANTLSRCLYAMRDHFKSDELIQAVSPALEKLVNSSPRFKPNIGEVWLLGQVLLLPTAPQHITGLLFVVESSVDLLLSTDASEDPAPNPATGNPRDSPNNNLLRCTDLLSRSLHVMRDHLTPDEFIKTISPALDKLADYWAQFQDDVTLYPDLNRAVVLPNWLEIRNALDRPDESGWGPHQQQQFGEAYPSLKLGFDAMALAAQGIKATPRVESSPEGLPDVAGFNEGVGRTAPHNACSADAAPRSEGDVRNPQVDASESQQDEDAREPGSSSRTTGRDNKA